MHSQHAYTNLKMTRRRIVWTSDNLPPIPHSAFMAILSNAPPFGLLYSSVLYMSVEMLSMYESYSIACPIEFSEKYMLGPLTKGGNRYILTSPNPAGIPDCHQSC
jgi:hypothetical protein